MRAAIRAGLADDSRKGPEVFTGCLLLLLLMIILIVIIGTIVVITFLVVISLDNYVTSSMRSAGQGLAVVSVSRRCRSACHLVASRGRMYVKQQCCGLLKLLMTSSRAVNSKRCDVQERTTLNPKPKTPKPKTLNPKPKTPKP